MFHKPGPYREGVIPTAQELTVVTDLLLKAADFAESDILAYDRDPAVLQELSEPLERSVIRKRSRARA